MLAFLESILFKYSQKGRLRRPNLRGRSAAGALRAPRFARGCSAHKRGSLRSLDPYPQEICQKQQLLNLGIVAIHIPEMGVLETRQVLIKINMICGTFHI